MNTLDDLPWTASADEYEREADALLAALKSGGDEARWRFRWEHPRFRDRRVTEIDPAALDRADARLVTARTTRPDRRVPPWPRRSFMTNVRPVTREDAAVRLETRRALFGMAELSIREHPAGPAHRRLTDSKPDR